MNSEMHWTPAQRRIIDALSDEWDSAALLEDICRAIAHVTVATPLQTMADGVALDWPKVGPATVLAMMCAILNPPQTPEEARQHAAALTHYAAVQETTS